MLDIKDKLQITNEDFQYFKDEWMKYVDESRKDRYGFAVENDTILVFFKITYRSQHNFYRSTFCKNETIV